MKINFGMDHQFNRERLKCSLGQPGTRFAEALCLSHQDNAGLGRKEGNTEGLRGEGEWSREPREGLCFD